jgi:ABC-type proline/glycine betaine transport system permease subunit
VSPLGKATWATVTGLVGTGGGYFVVNGIMTKNAPVAVVGGAALAGLGLILWRRFWS